HAAIVPGVAVLRKTVVVFGWPGPAEDREIINPGDHASVSANLSITNSSAMATRWPSTTRTADEAVARGSPVISSGNFVGVAHRSSRHIPSGARIAPAGFV